MSQRVELYGMPAKIIDAALSEGAHPRCLLRTPGREEESSCGECVDLVHRLFDRHYGHISSLGGRVSAISLDMVQDLAERDGL